MPLLKFVQLKEQTSDRFGLITHQEGSILEYPIGTPSSDCLAVLEELKPQYTQVNLQGLVYGFPNYFPRMAIAKGPLCSAISRVVLAKN